LHDIGTITSGAVCEKRLALGEPGRRSAHRVPEDAVEDVRRDRLGRERADHVPAPHDFLEFHASTLINGVVAIGGRM
jgi:hypothetical protein